MPAVLINPDFTMLLQGPLTQAGFAVLPLPRSSHLHAALSGHVDLSCALVEDELLVRPDMPEDFISLLSGFLKVKKGKTYLSENYPDDIAYNVAIAGKYYFHKKEKTDPELELLLKNKNIHPVFINQGYSRCTILPLPDGSIITADLPTVEKAGMLQIPVCKIEHGHIALPGFDYGFIGGCGGCYKERVYLTGSLSTHPDGGRIRDFIKERGFALCEITDKKLIDTGSLFFV